MITGVWGGRKVWFRISRFVIFYDKTDLRFSGFQVLQKSGRSPNPQVWGSRTVDWELKGPKAGELIGGLNQCFLRWRKFICDDRAHIPTTGLNAIEAFVNFSGAVEMETTLAIGVAFAFDEEMAEGFFPAIDDFDFNDFGVGEEVDRSPRGGGFGLSAELGLESVSYCAFGLVAALDFAPFWEELVGFEFGGGGVVGAAGDVGGF